MYYKQNNLVQLMPFIKLQVYLQMKKDNFSYLW